VRAQNAAIQGGLAVVGLLAAYVTWQRPKETKTNDTAVVVDASKQSLQKIHYEDGVRFLELTRTTDDEPRTWVTQGFLPGQPAALDAGLTQVVLDGGAPDGGAAMLVNLKPPEPTPTREVKGNERADTTWQRFAPLEATRALGVQPNDKLKELGLDDERRRLDVTVAGTARHFTVSKPQAGVFGTYLRENSSGQVYLMTGSMFSDLDPSAQVLIDRRLHTFKLADIDKVTVKADDRSVDLVVTNADIVQTMKVARASTPDKPDELVKNWYDKTWNRIVVTEVLGKGELPKAGEPKVMMRLEYSSHGKPKGFLEIAEDLKMFWWAKSENTAGWVAVHQNVEDLVAEAKKQVIESPADQKTP
jgi:hypothetical protein